MEICKHCGDEIHLATDPEKAGLFNKHNEMWRHDSGFWYCQDGIGNAAEPGGQPKTGKTLADFAGSDKLFKRPMHAHPYVFYQPGGGHLMEITADGRRAFYPRLTAEDLTATDWEEVAE